MGLEAALLITASAAIWGAGGAAVVEGERSGREASRDSKKRQNQILSQAEEQAELAREQAQRNAATQRARSGAAGVSGSVGLLIQESLISQFDEIQRLRAGAAIEATRVRKAGRNQAKALRNQGIIAGIQAVGTGASTLAALPSGSGSTGFNPQTPSDPGYYIARPTSRVRQG